MPYRRMRRIPVPKQRSSVSAPRTRHWVVCSPPVAMTLPARHGGNMWRGFNLPGDQWTFYPLSAARFWKSSSMAHSGSDRLFSLVSWTRCIFTG